MGRKRVSKKIRKLNDTKTKTHAKTMAKTRNKKAYICEKCQKSYSKKSNLRTHIESKHLGKKWVCPFCENNQASKFSHIRHVKKCTKRSGEKDWDPDDNAFLMLHHVDQTPEAKTNIIKNLLRRNESNATRIMELNKRLYLALKTIIELKEKLSYDTKEETKEISQLVKKHTNEDPCEDQKIVFKVPKQTQNSMEGKILF